ncbi:MAG: hypothetical protein COX62_05995 [Deltaproteobacteria bacterium CG_4_10_14_0_2_um_filter_43_8]|nr:MAG: hypothetical protein COV43_01600 [Deltaproteobacteria bacterium CG11_big_fil_rev_8_21_14_0_20_42_23]PJA19784.1 MAG: hypothetical protein COX62_05995 [Deltaproteobacteria bacterium CG_4_10_14_0_2_um_filter_43_8]PJC64664.1 MAG: hypothetical protein CO021_03115 [Deltaproteobacteria bacterium CG_4_9_14_0_2_um_filter_42_21]
MAFSRQSRKCFLSICAFLLCCFFTPVLQASTCFKPHVSSVESLQIKKCYREWKDIRKQTRHLKVTQRKLVRFKKSSFFNRRPFQFSHPAIDQKTIYLGVEANRFYAVDLFTLKKRWSFETLGPVESTAAFDDNTVFFGDAKGFLYALSKETGAEVWRRQLDDAIISKPLVADGKIYAFTHSGRLFAISRETGAELWHTDALEKTWGFSIHGLSNPTLFQDMIFVGSSSGLLVAYQKDTGDIRWLRQLGDRREQFFDVDTQSLVADDSLYTATADGGLFRIDPFTGNIMWSHDNAGDGNLSYHEGKLFVTGSGVLSAFDAKTGFLVWQQDFGVSWLGSPVLGNPSFIAVTTTEDEVYFVDRDNGDLLFTRYIPHGAYADPVALENTLYILANKSYLYGYKIEEKKKKWVPLAK